MIALVLLVLVADYYIVRFMARRAFDKLTRQRDGVPFVPFDECGVDRRTGIVHARMQWKVALPLSPNDKMMMSINGIMTEMRVVTIRREYSSPLEEVELEDARSYMERHYVR